MSQGELHALALSLFLPRATSSSSPFRFLVIDDPVQSMDPSKVDGLAMVLGEAADTHQVVVFTHDDRLPEAVRRLRIDANVVQVGRREGSVVEVREVRTPTQQAIDDARALTFSTALPPPILGRVVPGLCRLAIEATCVDLVLRNRLGRGDDHAEVEDDLEAAHGLVQKLALALFDDSTAGSQVYARLNQYRGTHVAAVKACNRGSHEGYDGDLRVLVDHTEALVHDLART